MYLKSIEVQGFKSFANKMTFEFHHGITGIVGPNGSGKSNIADAVRWVLGEQSAKQLRGAKMEDVIFSGTQMRKPLGFAYVAISLDNSDQKLPIEYNQVKVARRVYRSGESEYLINGNSCRLKDIQDLFWDTGIGKEGYSIIGQGQIDKILSGKPEDRRELFDEAAGIVKFKRRKAVAWKNLEAERQNLYRVTDILSELEKQIKPLQKQSEKAKEYLKLKEELKGLEVGIFLKEYKELTEVQKEIEKKQNITQCQLEETTRAYEKTKEEYNRLEEQLNALQKSWEEKQKSLTNSRISKEKLEGEQKVLEEQILSAKQNEKQYQVRKEGIEKKIEERKNEMEKWDRKKQAIQTQFDQAEREKGNLSEQLFSIQERIREAEKAVEQYNTERVSFLKDNTEIKTQMQHYETMLEQNAIKKVSFNQVLLKNKSEEAVLRQSCQEWKEQLKELSIQIKLLEEEQKRAKTEETQLEQKKKEVLSDMDQIRQEYHKQTSRLDSLNNMTERYEGYGISIQKVMERKEKKSGILGVVADLIKVEKTYETAIETALGGTIQNIVTDTEETAKEMIEYLKKNRYGRATFLPLTGITGRGQLQPETVLQEAGVIGKASDLVIADSKYKPLLEYLLGRILVMDQMDHAVAVARKYNHSLRIVTLEGELFHPGGSISGGAYKNGSSLLSRKREIEELEQQIQNSQTMLHHFMKKKEEIEEEQNKQRQKMESGKATLQALLLKQSNADMRFNQTQEQIKELEKAYRKTKEDYLHLEEQLKKWKEEIKRITSQLEENQNQSSQNEWKIKECNQFIEEHKKEETFLQERKTELDLKYASLEQNIHFISENIERMEQEKEGLKEELETLNREQKTVLNQAQEKRKEIENRKQKMKGYQEDILQKEEEISELSKRKEEISDIHKSFFSKREELNEQIKLLDKECFRLNNQKEKASEKADSLISYMWEEYELTYGTARECYGKKEEAVSSMKKTAGELKGKMKSLGDINVNAVEEYKQISERYELLKGQKEDIVYAEETLCRIIEELDIEMRKQFEEKFHEIQKQFDQVLKELFGGGKGTLELVEGEDILEAGIQIIAQPPGKKLQNMMQLSGGEKALTAISLLFAIQNLKPSPFCLLDEIEAALDDSNVERYAKYLKKLTKDTQFIIITHRRGTMAAADILYGITMQEKGISTMVSVNLIEKELTN